MDSLPGSLNDGLGLCLSFDKPYAEQIEEDAAGEDLHWCCQLVYRCRCDTYKSS